MLFGDVLCGKACCFCVKWVWFVLVCVGFACVLGVQKVAVEARSKLFLPAVKGHGKSPCFFWFAVLGLFSPGCLVLVWCCVDGADFLKCAL